MKHEAKFQTFFNRWLKNNYKRSGVFELKQTKSDSIPFSVLVQHQEDALWNTKHNKIVFKIPDGSFSPSPFDCFCLVQEMAFVVVKYPKFFCMIDIDDWIKEKKKSKRKSLTSERAKVLSELTVNL